MAPRRGTTRRRFLKSTALAVAGLGLPRTLGAATADLKLKKPIKIGCQTILSGPLGGYGEFMRKGATLAMEEINAQGGIGGSPIEISLRDEELKVDVGVKNARYFVEDWGADFLIGIDSSAVALAVGEIMPSLNRVLIVTHGATEKYKEDLVFKRHVRQCFRVCVPVYQDGIASARTTPTACGHPAGTTSAIRIQRRTSASTRRSANAGTRTRAIHPRQRTPRYRR